MGLVSLSAGFFDLDFALHLVNFGALTAFFIVNVCVIVQCYFRDGNTSGLKNTINFLILPFLGMLFIGYLWYNLEEMALKIGLVWGSIGIVYLAIVTKGFRKYPQAFLNRQHTVDD